MKHTYPFKGKFKDLKKKGYKFWKAFGHNYKVYSKEIGSRSLHVWVAHGGYIEYADLYGHTANFIETIKNLKDEDYRESSMLKLHYAYLVFDWDNMDIKPEVHHWPISHRVIKTMLKECGSDISSEQQFEEMTRIKKEMYGDKDMYEKCITKCEVEEILKELDNINKS